MTAMISMNRKMIIVLCFFACIFGMRAQTKKENIQLKGQIRIEGSTESIPFATITVHDDSAKIITRLVSDNNGRFTVELARTGAYQLLLSATGYTAESYDAVIHPDEKTKDMGIITMKEGVELKEVTVSAQKPLIKSDPDKLVYSVEADPEAQSNTLLEIIRKVPLLSVDAEENVTLNGQSNYKVLVNGKTSSLMSKNFKEVIKSMPANAVKDIEVITNPSSKYEAEGAGGVINIITTKSRNDGFMGSVGAMADLRGGFGVNAYISANIDKFSFSTNVYNTQYRQPESEGSSVRENLVSDEFHYMNSRSNSKYHGSANSLNFEAGYEIDTFNLISAAAWGYFLSSVSETFSSSEDRNKNREPVRNYTNTMEGDNSNGSLSGNIDYQRSFTRKDKTFTASYKFDYDPENVYYKTRVNAILNYSNYQQKSDNKAYGQTHTFQLDYFDPLTPKHQFETGVKGIYRINNSETEIKVLDEATSEWKEDRSRLNDLDYKQYIMGAYAGYLYKHEKISAKGGLRAEYTWNDGVSKGRENTEFNNTLFNIIPYINLTYQFKPAQTVKASYTQRLYRPGIWSLNPYVNDIDPMNISYGNPKLNAEISHSYSVSYGQFAPKFNVNVDLNSSITNNSIESYSFIDPVGVRHTTYGNIGSSQRYGINLYLSFRPNAKYNIYMSGDGNYISLKSNNELNLQNDGFVYGGNVGARIGLWKGGFISANLGGNSSWVMLQGKSSGYFFTSLGVTQKLLKEKLNVSVFVGDPLWRKIYYKSDYNDATFTMHTERFRWGQFVRLSLTYHFGKMNTQVKKARRGINNDDQRNGGSGGGVQQGN